MRLCVIAKLNHASSFQRHSSETNTISSLHSVGWAEERKEGKNHHQKTSLTKVLLFPPAGEDEKALSPDQLLKHRKPAWITKKIDLVTRYLLIPACGWKAWPRILLQTVTSAFSEDGFCLWRVWQALGVLFQQVQSIGKGRHRQCRAEPHIRRDAQERKSRRVTCKMDLPPRVMRLHSVCKPILVHPQPDASVSPAFLAKARFSRCFFIHNLGLFICSCLGLL